MYLSKERKSVESLVCPREKGGLWWEEEEPRLWSEVRRRKLWEGIVTLGEGEGVRDYGRRSGGVVSIPEEWNEPETVSVVQW